MEQIPNVNQWVTTLQKAQDGDERDAANQNTPIEGLADRTFFLYKNSPLNTVARPAGNSGDFLFSGGIRLGPSATIEYATSKSYVRGVKGVLGAVSADWTPELGGMRYQQQGLSTTAVGFILDCPPLSRVTTVSVLIDPSGGHGALPATMPRLQVFSVNMSDSSSAQIVLQVDATALPAYESAHNIVGSLGMGYPLLAGQYLVALVYGESGANAISAMRVYPPVVEFLRSRIGEE